MATPLPTPAEIHERVVSSRASQGLPPKVEDPATLERVAAAFARHERQLEAAERRREKVEPPGSAAAARSPRSEPPTTSTHTTGLVETSVSLRFDDVRRAS